MRHFTPERAVTRQLLRHLLGLASICGALSLTRIIPPASAQNLAASGPLPVAIVHVDVDPKHRLNSFDPDRSLGSSIDVLSRTGIDKVYTPHIVQESLSAGWGPITYRNNTELRMAAWHWTENGTWSDPARKSGYFTGSTELKEPLRYILAYALPHRGFSTSGDRPLRGPDLSYGRAIPISPASSPAKTKNFSPPRGGGWWVCGGRREN